MPPAAWSTPTAEIHWRQKAAATDARDFAEVDSTPGGSCRLHSAEEINIAQKQANTALKEHFNRRKPSISLKKRHSGVERAVQISVEHGQAGEAIVEAASMSSDRLNSCLGPLPVPARLRPCFDATLSEGSQRAIRNLAEHLDSFELEVLGVGACQQQIQHRRERVLLPDETGERRRRFFQSGASELRLEIEANPPRRMPEDSSNLAARPRSRILSSPCRSTSKLWGWMSP
jgi:hypothetical protein